MAAGQDQKDQIFSKGDLQAGGPTKSLGSCFSTPNFEVKEARKVSIGPNGSNSMMSDELPKGSVHYSASRSAMHTSASNVRESSFSVGIDDDDEILEVMHPVAFTMTFTMTLGKFMVFRLFCNCKIA